MCTADKTHAYLYQRVAASSHAPLTMKRTRGYVKTTPNKSEIECLRVNR